MFRVSWLVVYGVCCLLSGTSCAQETPSDDEVSIASNNMYINVGEKRVVVCNGRTEKSWYNPQGEAVPMGRPELRIHAENFHGTNQVMLMFNDAKPEDNGTWTCAAGADKKTIDIYIVERAKFEGMKDRETPIENARFEMSCRARGTPTPELSWYKDNVPIATTDKRYKVYPDGRLRIDKVNRADSGVYECKSSQIIDKFFFHRDNFTTVVQVQHPPQIERDSVTEVYAVINETKVLRCNAKAYPEPKYSWSLTDHRGYSESLQRNVLTADDGSYSELSLQVRSAADLVSYTCSVSNKHGKSSVRFHLQEGNKPHPPDQVIFLSATNQSMDFEVICENCTSMDDPAFSPDPENLPIIQYRLELTNGSNETEWDSDQVVAVQVDRTGNRTRVTVDGLEPETTYQIRAASVNSAGLSEFLTVEARTTITSAAVTIAPAIITILTILIHRLNLLQ